MANMISSAHHNSPTASTPYAALSQRAMRVIRRARTSSPSSAAAAASGTTAYPKPAPTMKITNQIEVAIVAAASAVTSYQPSMIVSVIWIEKPATLAPTSGKPRANSRVTCAR